MKLKPSSKLDRLIDAYLAVPHPPHRTIPTRYTRAKLKLLRNLFMELCQRRVRIDDLTRSRAEQLKTFLALQPLSRATQNVLLSLFLSLMRFAQKQGIIPDTFERPVPRWHARESRKLSLGDGSLWDVCQRSYFRLNLSIRSDRTRHQYAIALRDLSQSLGHTARPEDLSDDAINGMMRMLLDRGLAPKTVNERRSRINALWNWLARRRLVPVFPTNYRVHEPRRLPEAWNESEIRAIFQSCRQEPGTIAGIRAADWWTALHFVEWNSGERIGALLAVEWDALDWEQATLFIRAEIRKGQSGDMLYPLADYTLRALAAIRVGHGLIFPWDRTESTFYYRYKRILRRAGLRSGRKEMFHKLRKSVVSHLEAAGINATPIVGHSSREVTVRSYVDRKIARVTAPGDILFRPIVPQPDVLEGTIAGLIEGPTLPG